MTYSFADRADEIRLGSLLATEIYGGAALPAEYRGANPDDFGYDDDYRGYLEDLPGTMVVLSDAANLLGSHFEGAGIGRFTEGGLYRGTVIDGAARRENAEGLLAITYIDGEEVLVLSFRGTDGDDPAREEMQAFSATGNQQHYEAHRPLIEAALSFALAYDVPRIVVSGHSLGGAMVDIFTLVDAQRFVDAGLDLTVVALASPGVDDDLPDLMDINPDFANMTDFGPGTTITSLNMPDFYIGITHTEDAVGLPAANQLPLPIPPVGFIPNQALILNEQFLPALQLDMPNVSNSDVFYGGLWYRGFGAEHNGQIYLENLTAMTTSGLLPHYDGSQTVSFGIGDYPASFIGDSIDDQGLTQLDGTSGADFALGLTGDDVIVTGAGHDLLDGGSGSDVLSAGSGDDFLEGGAGADNLDGGGGEDTASYAGSDQGVTVSLLNDTAQDGDAQGDSLDNIENLIGSAQADELEGDNLSNRLFGGDGNDTLRGAGGQDYLSGGNGTNFLFGGDGSDTAVYTGNYSDYDIAVLADGRITVRITGQSLDVLSEIEQFSFYDATMAVIPTGGFSLSYRDNPDGVVLIEGADAADDISTAYRIEAGDRFEGLTDAVNLDTRERDWVAVDLIAGRDYSIVLHADAPMSPSWGAFSFPSMTIHNASGDQILAGSTSTFGNEITVGGTITETGTYFMAVSANTFATYNLEVSETSFPATQTEFIDAPASVETTYSITAGETFLGHNYSWDGDTDWIEVHLVAGRDYRFELETSGINYFTQWLTLFDADGEALQNATYTRRNVGDIEFIEGTATQTTTIYAAARAHYFQDYTLQFSEVTLAADVTEMIDADNSTQTEYRLGADETFSGYISEGGDRDWIAITLAENQDFTLTFTNATTDRLTMLIRNSDGDRIDQSGQVVPDHIYGNDGIFQSTTGEVVVNATAILAGTYYVAIQVGAGAYELNFQPQTVSGPTSGDDILVGTDGNDVLRGLAGNDTLSGGDGNDTLIGGAGNDILTGGTSTADLRDLILGGDGDDIIDGGYGNDELRGDAGNDTIAGGFGADTVIGGTGDDVMTGSAYSDLLYGGDGMDFVNGGFGHDRVNGGDGADRFFHVGVRGHGSDWIQDYDAAEGDTLLFGIASADGDDFLVNYAHTASATGERSGDDAVAEAFVIYIPTGQIMWALVDGAAQTEINLVVGGVSYDLLGV